MCATGSVCGAYGIVLAELRRDQKLLLASLAAALACWMIPTLRLAALPLIYLNTHLHELCHAIAAWATGGSVHRILVFGDGSGVTLVAGGLPIVVGSAGYLGAGAIGAAMVAAAGSERSARRCLWALSGALAFAMVLLVRGDVSGFVWGMAWVGIPALLAWRLHGSSLVFAAQFLGALQCLASLEALSDLVQIAAATDRPSDAQLMARATGIPDVFWAFLWALAGCALLWAGLRSAWRRSAKA